MHTSHFNQRCCGSGSASTNVLQLHNAQHPLHPISHQQQHQQHCQQQQHQQQQWLPHSQPVVAVSARCAAAVSPDTYAPSSDSGSHSQQQHQQQQQQQFRPLTEQHQDQQQGHEFGSRRGRLLIKQRPLQQRTSQQHVPGSLQQLRGSLPRGVVSTQQQQQPCNLQQQGAQQQLLQQHQQDPQQQQKQQQQDAPYSQQSLRDKNMSFSGALRKSKTLDDIIFLLSNHQWGPGFSDLDGVSVVGALVWLVKSDEWQQLQQEGSVGHVQWQDKKDVLQMIQGLLDRAEELVSAQNQFNSNSSSSTASAAAAAAAAAPVPVLVRPAELANLIYCCSKLDQQRPQLLAAAAAGLQLDLYACSTVELQRLIWGLAHARVNPGDAWLLNFCKAAQAKLFDCSPARLSALVYGVARLGYRPPDVWIAAWLEASLPMLGGMSPQQLANSAWGLSCFRFQAPAGWLSAFYSATSASMSDHTPTGFSQLAIALLTLSGSTAPPETWIQQLLQAVQPQLQQLELLHLCNLGKALANWQCHPEEGWMAAWLDASMPLLPAATPVDLSVLLWSCYKLSYIPQQRWLEAWFGATAASMPRCEPQQLTTLSLVLGEWGLVPAPGFSIDFWRASRARFKDFTPYQMSVLLWGLAKARRAVPNSWATALVHQFTQQLPAADPGDVCRFVGALSGVVVKPQGSAQWVASTPAVQQQLQQVVGWLVPQMREVEHGWMMQLVPGLMKLKCGLGLEAVQGLEGAAARMDERLTPGQRNILGRCFDVLRRLSKKQQKQRQEHAQQEQGQLQQQQGAEGVWLPERSAPDALW